MVCGLWFVVCIFCCWAVGKIMYHKRRTMNHELYSGTSGIAVPEQTKRLFPQQFQDKSRLTYYASLFNSLEINSTFRKIPMKKTVIRWAATVPRDFKFTFKFAGEITHHKDLHFNRAYVEEYVYVINTVGNKKGCLLIQFPGKFDITKRTQLENLLKCIKAVDSTKQWKVAIEFRNHSWYNEEIYDFLKRSKMSLVLHDLPPAAPPLIDRFEFIYMRFHGPEKGYRGNYSTEFLSGHAKRIKNWLSQGKEVYIYFNNTLGQAAQNLVTLNGLITEQV